VTLTVDPDYETQGAYSFAVIATDGAGNASDAKSITLSINNLDEVAPTITSATVADAIDENSGAGRVIYTATAIDSDTDVMAAPIIYSLAEGSDPALTIVATSGEVTLTDDPDHETQNQYSFAVIATDGAGNVSDAQSVTLDINNLDDTAPTITSGETATAINENSGAGQVIYTAQATDSDTDVIVPPITYSLAEGSDPALTIGATSGEVTLTDDPDHETQNHYSFIVIAADGAGNKSQQTLTLDINNLDEVAPIITSAETASVVETKPPGSVVYQTQVDDSADTSAGITFALSDDSDPKLVIDPVTGAVTLQDDPVYDPDELNTYSFTVIADDAVYQTEKAVTLYVIDADEESPEFTSNPTGAIDENIGENQVIYTAVTEDESVVTYSLGEG
jgi:hypothetical protein